MSVGGGGGGSNLKCFELTNGLDTVLYIYEHIF